MKLFYQSRTLVFFFTVWEFWGKMIYMVSLNQYNDLYLHKNKNMEV